MDAVVLHRQGVTTAQIAQRLKAPYSTVCRWLKSPTTQENIVKAFALCQHGKRGGLTGKGQQTKAKEHHKAEQELYKELKAKRAKGKRVSPRWLSVRMASIVNSHLGDACLPSASLKFDYNWRRRFYARYNLSTRKRTNKKSLSMASRLLKWQGYHERFRAFIQTGPFQCCKYGRYSPENRSAYILDYCFFHIF